MHGSSSVKLKSATDWKAALQGLDVPVDMVNFRELHGQIKSSFRHNLGIMYLFQVLKLPPVHKEFLRLAPRGEKIGAQDVFHSCTQLCNNFRMHYDEIIASSHIVHGPLKTHGFIMQMIYFSVLSKTSASARGAFRLGVSGGYYKLNTFSEAAKRAIDKVLDLHDTIAALLAFGPPANLKEWNIASTLLLNKFHSVRLEGVANKGYCALWAIRGILDGGLHESNMQLDIHPNEKLTDLPGPDQTNN